MKKYLLLLLTSPAWLGSAAQSYPNILSYSSNGTPTYGVKIKTMLPFQSSSQMPTITILGYSYGSNAVIGLNLVYYIYNSSFWHPSVSSFGAVTPKVYLANENGYVVIFIDQREYHLRFTVSAYAKGLQEQAQWFTGWTAVDEPVGPQSKVEAVYKNSFAGAVGIGTTTPSYTLDVVGTIRAHEVRVNTQKTADFVFADGYRLPSLGEVEAYISEHKHLPEVASADEMAANGVSMGELQIQLLQKVEELTLYVISLKKELEELKAARKTDRP